MRRRRRLFKDAQKIFGKYEKAYLIAHAELKAANGLPLTLKLLALKLNDVVTTLDSKGKATK